VAPLPVTNEEFTQALAGAVRRPALLPAPSIALKLVLGEMSALLLESQRVKESVSEKGYEFAYQSLGQALAQLVP
jgi:NAD dependent epimerase/dehydratase family enzyme